MRSIPIKLCKIMKPSNSRHQRPVYRRAGILLLGLFITFAVSCTSAPKEIPEDLEPIEYFQKAQHAASDRNNYKLAIDYYETFIERHPDDFQRIVEAKYEIAFLHYKQGKTKQAKSEFEKLLTNYEGENANVLPTWPRILAEKVLKKIEDNERINRREGSPEDINQPLQNEAPATTQ